MDGHLISDVTGRDIHLCQFHLDIATAAERWARNDLGMSELREAWIAPRGAAKSTWTFTILACWALVFGHRRFIAAFADNDSQARRHLSTLKQEFATNERLRQDFPDLCTPARSGGKSVSDTQNMYIARSGAVIMAHGIDSSQLGAKVGSTRPDLLLLDDCEPDEGNYSQYQKERRLSTIINGLLAMNPNAVVQVCGTVTMFGSIIHDLRRYERNECDKENRWVGEQNIRTRYYNPIVELEDGTEESFWPARYPMEYLNSIRGTTYFDLNFLNDPRSNKDALFKVSDFVVRELPTTEHVLWVDPAVTTHKTSDQTGFAVVGLSAQQKVLVEDAFGLRLKSDEIADLTGRMTFDNPTIATVVVECNQGGDVIADAIEPKLRPGCKLDRRWSTDSKGQRFFRFYDYHKYGWVFYADEFPELRKQMLGWGGTRLRHDDVMDAAASAVEFYLKDKPRPRST
jgi:phage terminase large subunit-like protein